VASHNVEVADKCAEAIEEGRSQCKYYSSQDVTKLIHIRAVSNELMDYRRGGGMLGVTLNLLMCDRGGTLYSVHDTV
jgi:hypothetical protein